MLGDKAWSSVVIIVHPESVKVSGQANQVYPPLGIPASPHLIV